MTYASRVNRIMRLLRKVDGGSEALVNLASVAMGVVHPFTGMLLEPIFAAATMALSSVTVVSNALCLRLLTPPRFDAPTSPLAAASPATSSAVR